MFAIVRLLVHLGLQSLRAHKTKSLIVGGLMTFGGFLVVVSLALIDSVERATRASIVSSCPVCSPTEIRRRLRSVKRFDLRKAGASPTPRATRTCSPGPTPAMSTSSARAM